MATKMQQILEATPNMIVSFGNWLSRQGLDEKSQYSYAKSGWLHRLSKGVYKIRGTNPTLLQTLPERCTSQKVKRLFLCMAEKAAHPWYNALQTDEIELGDYRMMIVPKGKYINRYNMTIPTELAAYE